jgi:hypothetical protein
MEPGTLPGVIAGHNVGDADVDEAGSTPCSWFQPVISAYKQMWQIIRLPMVLSLAFVVLTCRIPFGAVDSAITLKVCYYHLVRNRGEMLIPLVYIVNGKGYSKGYFGNVSHSYLTM